MNYFDWLDKDCTEDRPSTVENIQLAFTATSWLHGKINEVISLMEKLKHPNMNNRKWYIEELYDCDEELVTIKMSCHVCDWTESRKISIPFSWFGDDKEQLIKEDIDRINQIKEQAKKQRDAIDAARDEREYAEKMRTELAQYEILKAKYGTPMIPG